MLSIKGLSVCIAISASHYHVSKTDLLAVIEQPHTVYEVGPAGISARFFPELARAGFNITKVVESPCSNIKAGAWIIAHTGLNMNQKAIAAHLRILAHPNPVSAVTARYGVCVRAASLRYAVSSLTINHVILSPRNQNRIGAMGIPARWLVFLARSGFPAWQVRSDPCVNIAAGAFLLALEGLSSHHPVSRSFHAYGATTESPGSVEFLRPPPWMVTMARTTAARFNLSPDLLLAVGAQESGFDPSAVSPAGAQGLMQLMPFTAARFHVADSFNPLENINGSAAYLAHLMVDFHGDLPLVLAAYNAGGQAVRNHGGIPPFHQTVQYVKDVLGRLSQYQSILK